MTGGLEDMSLALECANVIKKLNEIPITEKKWDPPDIVPI